MNNQTLTQLNEVLAATRDCTFILNRVNTVTFEQVVQFVANARTKGMNDLNIARCIDIVQANHKISAVNYMKGKAVGAEAPAASFISTNNIRIAA